MAGRLPVAKHCSRPFYLSSLPCSAYNRVNGVYACENPMTLKTMLKGRYNFSGFVVCA